ncbi:hypothetical protein [Enterobacter roggenkampii]|uniref:hypothetical protein n=1 Tax=Enterobacter roggenkampii TaxID=1812935 RepID=UPI00403F1BAC
MDSQAYRVAVLLTINDQLSKNLAKVGRDAKELGGKFDAINKSILAITKSSEAASKALEKLNRSLNSPASSQALGAKAYADSMERAAKAAKQIASNAPASNAMIGGLIGIAATSSIAARTSAANMLPYAGGGRMLPPAGGALLLTGPGGGSGWKGWKNGVPPGGWGPGGGGGGGGNVPGNGRTGGGGSRQYGMENLAIAYGGFHFMQSAVDVGAEYQTLLARFSAYGMGDAAVKEADKFAQATKIMGASKNDMLRFFVEAQGVFRESGELSIEDQLKGARLAAPMMAKMQFAMASMDPAANHMTHAKEMDMLRFVEQAGGLNSPAKFNSIMNNAYKAVQSSGGNIDFSQLRQFMARAGTSAYNLSDTALYAKLEPIIGEMKGGAAGDALMTAYNRLTGTLKLPNQVVKQLEDMGVWDKNKIIHNSMGGIKSIIGGPGSQLTDLKLLASDPVEFYEKVIRPKYAAKGLSEEQIQLQNNVIFGRQGGKMFNLIEKQMHVIELAAKAFEKQMGIEDASKQTAGTYTGKKVDFDAKWKDFQLALAQDGGLLDTFTKGLTGLTTFLQKLTEFSNANPRITGTVMTLLEMVTVMATLKGGLWLVKHAASALFSPLELVTGTKGLPLLTSSLGGLYGIVARLVPLLGLFIPTNNTPTTTEELKTIQSKGAENWSKSNQGKPFAGTWQNQVMEWMDKHPGEPLSNYKGSQGGTAYPEPAKTSQTIQVNSSVYLDRNKVGDALTQHIIRQTSRAPTGPSGVDSSMNLIHAGMGSLVPR